MRFKNTDGLPDPLVSDTGEPIVSPKSWNEQQRPHLLELFRTQVYGKMPVGRPDNLTFEIKSTAGVLEGKAVCKQIAVHFEGPGGKGGFLFHLFLPTVSDKPVPAFLCIGHRDRSDSDPTDQDSGFLPVSRIIERGYAAAVFNVNQVAPDRNGAFETGVHAVFDTHRNAQSWGTLSAWAWACSRVMDYFETDADIDLHRVAVVGHSRGGKAALWCGAEDTRFALVISNDSGCSGAAVTRGKLGEQIAGITGAFPYWFCENYKLYADNTDDLPVDQHELIALIAPRSVYVASATEDTWSDPENEFLACVHAGPVFQLFGLNGVGSTHMPEPEKPLREGSIGYHLRTGRHDLTPYDWDCFMNFADKPGMLK